MRCNQKTLTIPEQRLRERFVQYDETKLTIATQSILNEFREDLFIEDVFAIIVEDVLNVLCLTEWNENTYKKIISSAQYIFETSDCFFPANEHFLFALSIVWVSYCCKYKNDCTILQSNSNNRSIVYDSKTLEYSICAQFFNYFAGPAIGKSKKIENYMFKLLKGDKVDLSKFQTKLPNGQGWKGPDDWKIVKDLARHASKKVETL